MTGANKIVIAAAGSGKTTYLVREASTIKRERVLITTYTEANEAEIRRKFFELVGRIPANVEIITWFKFLIGHGVLPFQGGVFDFAVAGMVLVNEKSGFRYRDYRGQPRYWPENAVENYYFDPSKQIYSDKLSKLVCRCNNESGGAVIDRIRRVFPHVFVDEVQDLAGYDLDILAALARSPARLLMVGDPRQVTYQTHHEQRFTKYINGGIVDFLRTELPRKIPIEIDETTLTRSHRNSAAICEVSSRLYPALRPSRACDCAGCRNARPQRAGVFILRPTDYDHYLAAVRPMQLRERIDSAGVNNNSPVMNFGESKGRGFDHVVILPTLPMRNWLVNPANELKPQSRARFYVALTRARYSVAVVMDWHADLLPSGFSIYTQTA